MKMSPTLQEHFRFCTGKSSSTSAGENNGSSGCNGNRSIVNRRRTIESDFNLIMVLVVSDKIKFY